MTTLRQEFVDLADELIGDEFADFAYDCVLTNSLGWDNTTQTNITETQTIKAIQREFKSNQFDGQKIIANDYMLIAEKHEITIGIFPDTTECVYRGEALDIKSKTVDSADAAVTFHVRRK